MRYKLRKMSKYNSCPYGFYQDTSHSKFICNSCFHDTSLHYISFILNLIILVIIIDIYWMSYLMGIPKKYIDIRYYATFVFLTILNNTNNILNCKKQLEIYDIYSNIYITSTLFLPIIAFYIHVLISN